MVNEFEVTEVLKNAPRPPELVRPGMAFFVELHAWWGTELDSLRGINAITRPFEQQQRTIAEDFYGLEGPESVMEVNRTLMNDWLFLVTREIQTDEQFQDSYWAFAGCQKPDRQLTAQDYLEVVGMVDDAIPASPANELEALFTPELFRARTIGMDMGKAERVQDHMYARHERRYTNHDVLIADVFAELGDEDQPGRYTDARYCMPGLFVPGRFSQAQIDMYAAMMGCGFHLAQFQKLETLPHHLAKFFALPEQARKFIVAVDVFDIAGAQGDRVQTGSPTLDHPTWSRIKLAAQALNELPPGADPATVTPEERALYSTERYRELLNEHDFHYSLNRPEGPALARYSAWFRTMREDDYRRLPGIFAEHMGEVTGQLFIDFMNRRDLWIEYGPALVRNLFNAMRADGVPYEAAMACAMTIVVVVDEAARRTLNLDDNNPATVAANDLANIAQQDWRRLFTERLVIVPAEGSDRREGRIALVPIPQTSGLPRLSDLSILRNQENGVTLNIGAGWGSDSSMARFTADTMIGDAGGPVVAYAGVPHDAISNAERVDGPVYLATPDTRIAGHRTFEDIAAIGGFCYTIAQTDQLPDALHIIGQDVAQKYDRPVTRIITTDTGGDILDAARGPGSRDFRVLEAAGVYEQEAGVQHSHTVSLIPGADGPPQLNDVAHTVGAMAYDISPHAIAFRAFCERFGLPTNDPQHYSQMLNIAALALAERALAGEYGLQPLRLPVDQARRGRPAYAVTHASMRDALVVDNHNLRPYLQAAMAGS